MRYLTGAAIAAFALGGHITALAQPDSESRNEQITQIEDVLVIGKRDDVLLVPGSGTLLIKNNSTERTISICTKF